MNWDLEPRLLRGIARAHFPMRRDEVPRRLTAEAIPTLTSGGVLEHPYTEAVNPSNPSQELPFQSANPHYNVSFQKLFPLDSITHANRHNYSYPDVPC